MSIIQGNTKVSAGGYNIAQSIRLNDDDSAYLSRTPASAGNRKTWTWSGWVKRGNLGSYQIFFSGGDGTSNNDAWVRFGAVSGNIDALEFRSLTGGSFTANVYTTAIFRDTSAWYHVVFAIDTTIATSTDRVKIYVNGQQQTVTFGTTPAQNSDMSINIAGLHTIGRLNYSATNYLDGYLSEINFIDGQALAPTEFGEFNDDGVWVPKAYTNAAGYGNNGFYITGADSADLGADYSGNGNDFTSSGLTSDDQRGDTPTANHATWNPLFFRRTGSYKPTFADGNLYVAGQSSQVSHTGTTISSTGKHYAEFLVNNGSSSITGPGVVRSYWDGGLAQSYAHNYGGSYYADNGTRYYNNTSDSQTAPGANRIGIEVDFANNEVEYFIVTSGGTKTSQGGKLTSVNGIDFDGEGIFSATLHDTSSRNITAYFEEADWWGTPSTGYKALSTANLPTPTIKDGSAYFNTILYTGDGSATTRSLTGVGFQPDFVWKKVRSAADNHWLHDAVRGADKGLNTNRTDSEYTSTRLTSFDSDGFSFATNDPDTNGSGRTYVAWNWLAGNGTASNTDGDFTSTVSANQTAGFSVVTWTGDGTSTVVNSIGHGLGKAPSLIIMRRRSPADDWFVYAEPITQSYYLRLNSIAAQTIDTGNNTWGGTAPTSSVFYTEAIGSAAYDYVAYCFAEVEGFSKFGKYIGNGSADGPFVWCGFRPAFVLVKRTNSADNWVIVDSSRNSYNVANLRIYPDTTNADITSTTHDFLSNGFKLRASDGGVNGSASTYIFMAFAEHPFGGSAVAPVPAR